MSEQEDELEQVGLAVRAAILDAIEEKRIEPCVIMDPTIDSERCVLTLEPKGEEWEDDTLSALDEIANNYGDAEAIEVIDPIDERTSYIELKIQLLTTLVE